MSFTPWARSSAALLALTSALLAWAPDALADDLVVELGAQVVLATDPSYDLIDDRDTLTGLSLAVGVSPIKALPMLRVLGLYQASGPDNPQPRLGDRGRLAWSQTRLMAAMDLGPEVFGFLRPYARMGAGYSLQSLTWRSSSVTRHDYAHDVVGFGALGIEAFLTLDRLASDPAMSWLTELKLGVSGQLGLLSQTDATFDELRPDQDTLPADDPWTRQALNLGRLKADGAFWSLGVTARMSF